MACELTAELLISVDGWAGSEGLPGYFGYLGPELEAWMAEEEAKPHVALMGRKTYDLLSDIPQDAKDELYDQMVRQETVVFSETLAEVEWPAARVSGDAVAEVRRLREESDVPLRTVGSPSLVRTLNAGGLVDCLRLVIFPLLAGPPGREAAFEGIVSTDLDLAGHRVLDGRVLIVEYRPTGRDIPRG